MMRILGETKLDSSSHNEYWEDQEFEDLSAEIARSYCSSVFSEVEDNMLDKKRAVPYDFFTIRKAKKFFKEDYVNLTRA